jgi:D-tyrosyl-tRNA(Tyr) deacylase
MVKKVLGLRIFDDENGVMNKSVVDIGGSILSISQFTLYGDASKGNRPSYIKALNGKQAVELYNLFNEKLSKHIKVETGIFGAEMEVSLLNDGPVTIILEK